MVAYHNRVVTEGLRPSQGNYISHILSEKKFISSCNEFKTNYCHHSNTQPVGTRNNLLHPTSWSLTSEHYYFCSIKRFSQLQQQEDTLTGFELLFKSEPSRAQQFHSVWLRSRNTLQHMEDTNTVNTGSPTHLWKIRYEN